MNMGNAHAQDPHGPLMQITMGSNDGAKPVHALKTDSLVPFRETHFPRFKDEFILVFIFLGFKMASLLTLRTFYHLICTLSVSGISSL